MPLTGEFRPSGGPRRDQPGQERDGRPDVPRRATPPTATSGRSRGSRARYEERLRKAGALDFDDLLLEAVRLFDEAPDVLRALPGSLALPPRRRVPGHEPAAVPVGQGARRASTATSCVVGDDDQSIYRGAAPTCATSSTSSATTRTRRSSSSSRTTARTQLILDAAHAVVSRNTARTDKKLWTDNAGGRPIQRFEAYDEEEEAEWIARQVEGLVGGRGSLLTRRGRRGRGRAAAPGRRRDVPDERPVPGDRGGVPPLRHPLPARRRHAVLPAARGQGRARLPAGPPLAIPTSSLRADRQRAGAGDRRQDRSRRSARRRPGDGLTTWEAIEAAGTAAHGLETLTSRARNALAEFAVLIRRLRARIGVLPLPELLDEVLEASGYRAMLADGSEDGEERWANLLELRSVTTRYDDLSPEDALDRLLEETALVADQDTLRGRGRRGHADHPPRGQGPRVPGRLHRRARGGRLPAPVGRSTRSVRCAEEPMEEERRLAYVGITRAKRRLYLIPRLAPRRPWGMGQLSIPSRFLLEIPAELMDGPLLVESEARPGRSTSTSCSAARRTPDRRGASGRHRLPPGEWSAGRTGGGRDVPADPRPGRQAGGVRGRRSVREPRSPRWHGPAGIEAWDGDEDDAASLPRPRRRPAGSSIGEPERASGLAPGHPRRAPSTATAIASATAASATGSS